MNGPMVVASAKQKSKATTKKLTRKERSGRFKEIARELGCDKSEGALERAFAKIEPKSRGKST